MKALKRIFAVLLVSAMAFGLVAQAADSKETVTLTFSVDSALNGTYKTSDGNCYLKLTGGAWELGASVDGKEMPLYKGTCTRNDTSKEIVFTKTHCYGAASKSWKDDKADKWKTGGFDNKTNTLSVTFSASELAPKD